MAKIYYHAVPADWRKEQKYKFLDEHGSVSKIDWTEITPDAKQNWLTAGMEKEFDGFISIGNKEARTSGVEKNEAIVSVFSNGVKTNRDSWCYNFTKFKLANQIQITVDCFNGHVRQWQTPENQARVKFLAVKKSLGEIIDQFVEYVPDKIAWTRDLKLDLNRSGEITFDEAKIRRCAYRPYVRMYLYFDRILNEEVYSNFRIFPTPETENENRIVALTAIGNTKFSYHRRHSARGSRIPSRQPIGT